VNQRLALIVSIVFVLGSLSPASAQLLVARDGPIVYGHHHLNVSNLAAHKKFFVETLGGTAVKVGANSAEIVKFPNVLIFFRQLAPSGGTKGTTVNHIGFSVPNLRHMVDKVKANGYRMITRDEVAPNRAVKDDIAAPATPGGASIAFIMGPDDTKVELVEVNAQTSPIALHHVHFFNPPNADMRAWYVKVFGGKPGIGGGGTFLTATLPGVTLNFSPSMEPVVGTQGRSIDHIGFEVKNLEVFCKGLERDGITLAVAYHKVAALDIAVAFITDPWGTYIELTEGLDKIS
jgi:catechol 2,3-dioxygenase-like lactoylglutathione lyase family enzyme